MSTESNNGSNKQPIKIPTEYWFVCGEWKEIIQEPSIATADNPHAQGRMIAIRKVGNDIVNVHPIIHATRILQSGQRPEYAVTFAMPISKMYYDLVMAPTPTEQQVADIADKIEKEKTGA